MQPLGRKGLIAVVATASLIGVSLFAWRASSQREAAQDRVERLQLLVTSLQTENAGLMGNNKLAQSEFASASVEIQGLQGQVGWDKSHLLDCWTVIAREVPPATMPDSLEPLRQAARPTGSTARLITRCVSDAVP
jgi:hypothetical protein